MRPITLSKRSFSLIRFLTGLILFLWFFQILIHQKSMLLNYPQISHLLYGGLLVSIIFALGAFSRFCAIFLLLVLLSLQLENEAVMVLVPGYLGFFLILQILMPEKVPLLPKKSSPWGDAAWLVHVFLCVIAFSFSYSGITKLMDPNWVSGNVLDLLVYNPRMNVEFMQKFIAHGNITKLATWCIIAFELFAFPLFLIKRTRMLSSGLLLILFLCIFSFSKMYYVIGAVMIFILALFLSSWEKCEYTENS